MPFTPAEAHISVALVISGSFTQFADPLDWVARSFGIEAKVDRTQLMESLSMRGTGVVSAGKAIAQADSTDTKTRFRMELFGRCEGQLVALCACSYNPYVLTRKFIEETAVDIIVLNGRQVLGVQSTSGAIPEKLPGIENEKPLIRLLPLNVFSRSYFQSKLELIEGDKKIKLLDAGGAAVVYLAKPWQFYDVPRTSRKAKKPQNLLPF